MAKTKFKSQFVLQVTDDDKMTAQIEGKMLDIIHMLETAMLEDDNIIDLFFFALIHMVGDIEQIKSRAEAIKRKSDHSALSQKGKVVN